MPFNYNDIRSELKQKPRHLLFEIKPDKKFQLIKTGNTKTEVKNFLKTYKKINDKNFYMLLSLSFHSGSKSSQGGPLMIMVKIYRLIDGKIKNIIRENKKYPENEMTGAIWFGKKFLEKKGWKDEYIENIIEKLIHKKTKIIVFGKSIYEIDFL